MHHFFFDASAFVKRYHQEPGSEVVNHMLDHCCPRQANILGSCIDFIELLDLKRNHLKSGFTTESQRSRRKFSYDPIGRRRSNHKLHPFGNRIISSSKRTHTDGIYGLKRVAPVSGLDMRHRWLGIVVGPSQPIDILSFRVKIWPIWGLKAPILALKRDL